MKNNVNVPSKRNKHKTFVGVLEVPDEKSSQRYGSEDLNPHADPYQNVTDPKRWFLESRARSDLHTLKMYEQFEKSMLHKL
jgi:hypothetical protein